MSETLLGDLGMDASGQELGGVAVPQIVVTNARQSFWRRISRENSWVRLRGCVGSPSARAHTKVSPEAFVIGMPRSGTSLVEQIIASHPMVFGAGELRNFNDVVLTIRGADGKTFPYPECVPALTTTWRSSGAITGAISA